MITPGNIVVVLDNENSSLKNGDIGEVVQINYILKKARVYVCGKRNFDNLIDFKNLRLANRDEIDEYKYKRDLEEYKYKRDLEIELNKALAKIEELENELDKMKNSKQTHSSTEKTDKTGNQLRKEVIEKAKELVYKFEEEHSNHYFLSKGNEIQLVITKESVSSAMLKSELLIKKVLKTRCCPEDVFNEWIGKAILVQKFYGRNADEFENAPQPSHYAIGQIGISVYDDFMKYRVDKISRDRDDDNDTYTILNGKYAGRKANGNTSFPLNYVGENYIPLKIIEDTLAEY